MSAVVGGIIGGAVAVALATHITRRTGKAGVPGQLCYGSFLWVLGFVCLALALLPIGLTLFLGYDKDLWARLVLLIGFSAGAVYCLVEAAFVRGTFDEDGIVFSTPWTGRKREKWADLVSVELNAGCSWYVLTFRSGDKVRLSQYLLGHLVAVEMAEAARNSSSRRV